MEDSKEFFKTLLRCFNPDAYVELSKRDKKDVFSYFLSLLIVAFFIMMIIMMPRIVMLPNVLTNEFSKFSIFTIQTNINQTEPIHIGKTVMIDFNNIDKNNDASFIINNEEIKYKILYATHSINITGYYDVGENKMDYMMLIWLAILLMMPSILFIIYIFYILRYAIILFVVNIIAYIIVKMFKMKESFSEIINISLYSSTIFVLIEVITRPFLGAFYYIPFFCYLVYFMIAIIMNGKKQ